MIISQHSCACACNGYHGIYGCEPQQIGILGDVGWDSDAKEGIHPALTACATCEPVSGNKLEHLEPKSGHVTLSSPFRISLSLLASCLST